MKASFRVAIVFNAARASMMNGSQRTPAKTRIPGPAPPSGSSTRKETDPPHAWCRCPAARATGRPARGRSRRRRSRGRAPSPAGTNGPDRRPRCGGAAVAAGSGRSARRRTGRTAAANGSVFITSTSVPAARGLGNAYTSVMSAIGSARARGPEMWSDMRRPRLGRGLIGGLASSGCSAGCWRISAACGWSSTCWNAAFTRCAFRISLTVPP